MNTANRDIFYKRCKEYFGDRADEFIGLLSKEAGSAFFLNERKAEEKKILELIDFEYERSALSEKSFTYRCDSIGKTRAYELGLIYPQDTESSLPTAFVDTEGIRLAIDLCAAPGGKSVNILNRLPDDALLIANDVSYKRASVLSANLERLGLDRTAVTCKRPDLFEKDFRGVFDLVILDAPCSGEGMIRKYPEILDEYSIANIRSLSQIQKKLLETAYILLNEGGQLLYSTCTYAFEEDEEQVRDFLSSHNDMELIKLPCLENSSRLEGTLKLSPLNGTEGQFMALFRKKGQLTEKKLKYRKTVRNELVESFIRNELHIDKYYLYNDEDRYYLSLYPLIDIRDNVLCSGIYIGKIINRRFEPSHALYRADSLIGKYKHVFDIDDREYDDFISGKEVKTDREDGWYMVSYRGHSLGHGKCSKGILKNKYPKGLRRMV